MASVRAFAAVGRTLADDLQNGSLGFVDGKPGGVQVDGVGSLHQRRFGAPAVALIAVADLLLHNIGRQLRFVGAARGTLLRVRIEKILTVASGNTTVPISRPSITTDA